MTQEFCWISNHNRVRGNVFGDNPAGSDNRVFTDPDIAENRGAGSDRCSFFDYGLLDLPVGLGLQIPAGSCRARIAVIDEGYVVTDENIVLNRHTFTDEGMARDLAAPPN